MILISRNIPLKAVRKFVEKKGLKLHHFEGLDVVDYGGVLEVVINE